MTPEDLRRVRDLCVRRATTKLSLDEEHAVIYELANAAPWLLDELEARDAAIEKLREAFASYRTRGGWDDFVRALRSVLDWEETQ